MSIEGSGYLDLPAFRNKNLLGLSSLYNGNLGSGHYFWHADLTCLNYQTERIGVARSDYEWCSVVVIEQLELICQLLISVWTVHHQKM